MNISTNYYPISRPSPDALNTYFKNTIKFPLKGLSCAIQWALFYNPQIPALPIVNTSICQTLGVSRAVDFVFISRKLPEQMHLFLQDPSLNNFRTLCISSVRGIYNGCSVAKRFLPLTGRLLASVSLVGAVASLLAALNCVSTDVTGIYLGQNVSFSTITRLSGDTLAVATAGLKLSVLASAPMLIFFTDTAAFMCAALSNVSFPTQKDSCKV